MEISKSGKLANRTACCQHCGCEFSFNYKDVKSINYYTFFSHEWNQIYDVTEHFKDLATKFKTTFQKQDDYSHVYLLNGFITKEEELTCPECGYTIRTSELIPQHNKEGISIILVSNLEQEDIEDYVDYEDILKVLDNLRWIGKGISVLLKKMIIFKYYTWRRSDVDQNDYSISAGKCCEYESVNVVDMDEYLSKIIKKNKKSGKYSNSWNDTKHGYGKRGLFD